MKNKLMTTALVSSMLGLGVNASVAQTTVSGNLELTYNAVTNKAAPLDSFRGFGKESQINIANKGKLSNGMDYAAGFSLEFDGPDVNFATATANAATGSNVHSENVYIDLIMGNTTLTFGADHIQNPDSNPTNIAGFGYIGLDGLNGQPALYPKGANSPYSAYGVGVMQTVPGIGTFSAYYAPTNNTNNGAGNDIFNSATATQVEPGSILAAGEESAYELGFKGDLGVKGLNVMAFVMRADAPDGEAVSTKGRRLAATYTTGNFTVAVDHVKVDGVAVGASANATNRDFEVKGKSLGLGYAITPAVSASVTRAKADTNCSTGGTTCGLNTETTDIFAIGYNLGALTTTLQYKAASDVHGVADRDGKSLSARIGAKF